MAAIGAPIRGRDGNVIAAVSVSGPTVRIDQAQIKNLALLVMDESNPRALACVLLRLRTELGKLPVRAGEQDDWLSMLPVEGVGVPLDVLSDPDTGPQAVMDLLKALIDMGWRLSDEVGRRYFAHAEPTDSMVSV